MITNLGNTVALDENGREFPKYVTLIQENNSKPVIEFGLWEQYNVSDLLDAIKARNDADKFYLDLMGKNHMGSGVYITVMDLRAFLLASLEVIAR